MSSKLASKIIHDGIGPEYILEVYDRQCGMHGFLVIDNTALGPGKGGIRMTAGVTVEEVFRLARTMTWKNALAGLPFGGAKAGIVWAGGPEKLKREYIESFARALKPFLIKKYIAGPDVSTGEREMKWFVEAAGNWRAATGKPANYCMATFGNKGERCGIPHEFGSTGFGVAQSAAAAIKAKKMDINGATVAIHGFGNVGTFTHQFLTEMGAKVVALADTSGAVWSKNGFNDAAVRRIVAQKKRLLPTLKNHTIPQNAFWGLPVDVLIPASVTDVIHDGNKDEIKAKIIVEAGNIPMQERIERELSRRGILIVPDFVANAGGVISSYAEYRGYNPKRMFELVKSRIANMTRRVLERSAREKKYPREVAFQMAHERVAEAMRRNKTGAGRSH